MAFLSENNMIDAKRFETIAHASVMTSGRLRFATDAIEMMGLSEVKGIILFDTVNDFSDETVFGAVPCKEEDARAFSLKSSGPYKYLSLKNFFLQREIDYKNFAVTFEVTEVNELYEEKPVYRLTMRQVRRQPKTGDAEASEVVEDMPF